MNTNKSKAFQGFFERFENAENYMVVDNLFNHIEGVEGSFVSDTDIFSETGSAALNNVVEGTFVIEERRLFDEITDENMDDDVMPAVA